MRILAPGFLALLCTPSVGAQEALPLTSGETYEGSLDVGLFGQGLQDFVIEVPREAIALDVQLRCREVDLDVYVTYLGEAFLGEELSGTDFGVERVVVDFVSSYPLRTGKYEVSVQYAGTPLPVWEGKKLDSADFSLTATLHGPRVDAVVEPGVRTRAVIDAPARRLRTFQVEVPDEANALRVDITETFGDLDLYARRSGPILRRGQVTHEATNVYGRETLVVTRGGRPKLLPGTWYIDVVDYGSRAGRVPFELLVSFDAEAPEELLALPEPLATEGLEPLERAAAAVVDLYAGNSQGSGTFLSRDGWILTNAHVVSDYADRPMPDVVVALPSRLDLPPVETFRARVVEFDRRLDLALLHVESGFYGQPLPDGYRFPSVEVARERPRLAHPIWVLGYPWIGGSGGRVSVTLTGGVICGFDHTGGTSLIKTDAEVSEGNSGGAAVDAQGRLLGVPTSVMEDGSSQISFVVPITNVPESWWEHVRSAQ